ncbi:hypothetical protein C0Q70_06464 [Pomacea canaliculata]|uniref:Uncharacterized protein n=1 Tax=Pomacea canaliculata TaxID=400727 RepID=A0A2T7PP22_POMCA|nr:hypothetical protein C0Q70_06464 [Pomacea canaliculata]
MGWRVKGQSTRKGKRMRGEEKKEEMEEQQMIDDYKGVGITVYLGGVRDEVWRALEGAEVTAKHAPSIYLTVYDAVQAAQEDQRKDKHLEEMNSKHTNSDPEATAHDQLLTRVESHQV